MSTKWTPERLKKFQATMRKRKKEKKSNGVSKETYILCKKIRKELDKSPGITDLKIYAHLLLKELGCD